MWPRQFTSIPRTELAGLTAYAAQHRLPLGAADVAAAAAPRERAAPGAADGAEDDDGDSEEARSCAAFDKMSLLGRCTCIIDTTTMYMYIVAVSPISILISRLHFLADLCTSMGGQPLLLPLHSPS